MGEAPEGERDSNSHSHQAWEGVEGEPEEMAGSLLSPLRNSPEMVPLKRKAETAGTVETVALHRAQVLRATAGAAGEVTAETAAS